MCRQSMLCTVLCSILLLGVWAHAESGRSSAPANECPKCPVCPIAQGQVITPPSYGSSIPVKKKETIPAGPVTPVCLPTEYMTASELGDVAAPCSEWYANIKNKWLCTIDEQAYETYIGTNPCAPGYQIGQLLPYLYYCHGYDANVTPTCDDGGKFFSAGPVLQSIKSDPNSYLFYTCKRKDPPPDGQDSECGPLATNVGTCCVVLNK